MQGSNVAICSQCLLSGHFSQYDAFAMRRGRQMAWLGRAQIEDCTNVVAGQAYRFRGPRYR